MRRGCVSDMIEAQRKDKVHRPLSPTDCAHATILLLLLPLLQDGLLLDFDEVSALVLARAEPELLDALALLGGAGGPYLVVFRLLLASRWRSGLVGSGRVGGWGRWMVMGVIMAIGMRGYRRL